MINWNKYKADLKAEMQRIKMDASLSQTQAYDRIANAIANGYTEAMAGGGDPILKAKAVIPPIKTTVMANTIKAGLIVGQAVAVKMAIDLAVMTYWAGVVLNTASCLPLPGHIGHAPVTPVMPTGVMQMMLPIFTPVMAPDSEDEFIDKMIMGMRIHATALSGIHPTMILPPPAPPYPLPWVGYL